MRQPAGQGTTFRIYLPRLTGPANPTPGRRQPPPYGTETILLVEDDDHCAQVPASLLSQLGLPLLEAANGPEALLWEQHRDLNPALLTDLVMPGGVNGKDLGGQLWRET